ncbi:hypothetical protein GCM10008013_41170 [Paenibacillus segetis]|uniref:Uncharacterized protein n=1 Tax=Paenibacillus segetis TaxID=1325360 RepID=A0ABQ1YS60_9BACL|nr:hypothetical protein GCM10008013_41170 [Paenibacillus segetis]
MRLSEDLMKAISNPIVLFRASEAAWITPLEHPPAMLNTELKSRNIYVTHGTFMYKASNGDLLMLWASHINNVYAMVFHVLLVRVLLDLGSIMRFHSTISTARHGMIINFK